MNKSIWNEFTDKPNFEKLRSNASCDVLIIGGGMAGILTAYYLQQTGRKVIVAEAEKIGSKITSNTTAVLSAQHDTLYSELLKQHDFDVVKAYLDMNLDAVEKFEKLSAEIDCDFKRSASYVFSKDTDLDFEIKALKMLGYSAELVTETELPFKIKSAVKFPNMAEFHPLKFLYGLAKKLTVFEDTRILNIKEHKANTEDCEIRFGHAVVATHFPFLDKTGWFFAKMYQMRSYVMALENVPALSGTYNDLASDGFYFRSYENSLLVGQGDHRTGTKTDAIANLKNFAENFYPEAKVKYLWANQDCVTLDNLPYIGKYGNLEDVYTLTGFNLWGMTNSMVGAKIITDMINRNEKKNTNAFCTSRKILRPQLFKNLGVTFIDFINPKLKRCPHLGCALKYNNQEHSWDCPCHGSRFDENGKLIDNPANQDLQ